MKILIVEDEHDFKNALIKLLIKRGHEVEEASNGEIALNKFLASSDTYDVIVSDIQMPLVNGVELLEKIREKNFELPIILMTGYGDIENTIKALKYDAFDFLVKPFELRELALVLEKLETFKAPVQELKKMFQVYQEHLQITIPSQTGFIQNVIKHLHSHFKATLEVYKINRYKFALCIQEALTNAIVHGNLQVESSLKEESWPTYNQLIDEREVMEEFVDKKIKINCELNNKGIIVQIEDEGTGFNHNDLPDPNDPMSLLCSGRGILIIQQFMNEVTWNNKGNVIKMIKWRVE